MATKNSKLVQTLVQNPSPVIIHGDQYSTWYGVVGRNMEWDEIKGEEPRGEGGV